ncbi:MAG: epimerase [Myxococcota bacterium]
MNVVIFGATGMIGHGVLLEALDDEGIASVLTVGRRTLDLEHPKLEQLVHDDFSDFSSIEGRFAGLDACFWCLGVSSSGMKEDVYRRITVDFTMAGAAAISRQSPSMTFCFISGAGTDRESRTMWSRVKAEAEDRLDEFNFGAVYRFRPAMIQPMRGVRSTIGSYNAVYAVMKPFYPLLKKLPKYVTSTVEVGRAMIRVSREGAESTTLENAEICALAAA